MSEVEPSRPGEADEITWGESGSPEQHTKPTGTMPDGWVNAQQHPYDEENWLNRAMIRVIKWMSAAYVREFSTLSEGIDEVAAPRCFRVHPPAAGERARLAQVFDTEGTGGAVSVTAVCTDGERIYYAQGDTVYATSPASLTDDWSFTPVSGVNVVDLWTDGRWVYALVTYDASGDEIWSIDCETGGEVYYSTALASPTGTAIRANGEYLTILQGNYCRVYNGLSGTPSYQGQADHTAAINALAMDAARAYIGGTQGTDSKDVRGITLSTQSAVWSVALPTTATPTVNAIATDGEYVYVGTNLVAVTGGNAQLFCLSAWKGLHVWTMPDESTNINRVAVDDRYVYASEDSGTPSVYVVDKRTGEVVDWYNGLSARDCDGLSVCGANGNNVQRRWRGNASREFMRAAGADPNRRPFHKLAIPLDAGL